MTILSRRCSGRTAKGTAHRRKQSALEEDGFWKEAPVLVGTTKFEPLPDVKNIMITGGAGFIACWLVRHLVLTYPQYRIVSFDKLDYCSSMLNTMAVNDKPNFTFCHGDITKPRQVLSCLESFKIDTIFHFAAQSHVDLSFGNSYGFTHTNVYGTHVLLESAKQAGVKRFIHVSTDEVYGEVKDDDDDLLESSILSPSNPYAASKAAAEMLVHSYQKSFKLPVIIVRSNNVYGPHQYPEKIIPKFICLLNRGQPVVIHGDGSPTRRYLYAGDAADAFDTILHKGQLGQIYNVGSQDEISNLDLCSKLFKEMGIDASSDNEKEEAEESSYVDDNSDEGDSKGTTSRKTPKRFGGGWIKYTHDRPFNDHRYAVDATKLKKLGWEQNTSFEDGLRKTVAWYRQFGERWWGDISSVLSPFPVVDGYEVLSDDELVSDEPILTPAPSRPPPLSATFYSSSSSSTLSSPLSPPLSTGMPTLDDPSACVLPPGLLYDRMGAMPSSPPTEKRTPDKVSPAAPAPGSRTSVLRII